MLEVARASLNLSDDDHEAVEHEVRLEAYRDAMLAAVEAGTLNLDDPRSVESFRARYAVRPQDHAVIEIEVRREQGLG
jgi:hypothetical protein